MRFWQQLRQVESRGGENRIRYTFLRKKNNKGSVFDPQNKKNNNSVTSVPENPEFGLRYYCFAQKLDF